jgi:hypothetical protein
MFGICLDSAKKKGCCFFAMVIVEGLHTFLKKTVCFDRRGIYLSNKLTARENKKEQKPTGKKPHIVGLLSNLKLQIIE